jgi:hypothetical protein
MLLNLNTLQHHGTGNFNWIFCTTKSCGRVCRHKYPYCYHIALTCIFCKNYASPYILSQVKISSHFSSRNHTEKSRGMDMHTVLPHQFQLSLTAFFPKIIGQSKFYQESFLSHCTWRNCAVESVCMNTHTESLLSWI